MDFQNQVVIVTGGAKGIGKQISAQFGSEGAKVGVFDYDWQNGIAVCEELAKEGGEYSYFQVDVSDADQVKKAVYQVLQKWNRVDVLVNNAGISNPKTMEQMSAAEWDQVIQVNLTGAFHCASAVIAPMKEQGSGKIINISSVGGKRISFAGGIAYTSSKAGVIGFTRHLAYELKPYGINVNCVCPGGTLTPLYQSITDETTLQERVKMIPAGRLCTPQDIAHAVQFLASDKADMICGVSLDVDGGSLLGWLNVAEYFEKRSRIINERGMKGDS